MVKVEQIIQIEHFISWNMFSSIISLNTQPRHLYSMRIFYQLKTDVKNLENYLYQMSIKYDEYCNIECGILFLKMPCDMKFLK